MSLASVGAYTPLPKSSYLSSAPFDAYFYSYDSVIGVLGPVFGASPLACPANRVLRTTGRALYPDANPGVTNFMVSVYDSESLLTGYIDPNAAVFAVYSTTTPYSAPRGVDPLTLLPNAGPPVYTQGRVNSGPVSTVLIVPQLYNSGFAGIPYTNTSPNADMFINPNLGNVFEFTLGAAQSALTGRLTCYLRDPSNPTQNVAPPAGQVLNLLIVNNNPNPITIIFSPGTTNSFISGGPSIIPASSYITFNFTLDGVNAYRTYIATGGNTGDTSTPGPTGPAGADGGVGPTGPTGPGVNYASISTIAIGQDAGLINQGAYGVAIGYGAGMSNQIGGVAIGHLAGQSTQRYYAIAIGEQAGQYAQANQSVALGFQAGNINQGPNAIAIGVVAGASNQDGIAIGSYAGAVNQLGGIAIGETAGEYDQGYASIAIGIEAALFTQSTNAIAIGHSSGYSNQGVESIAIGSQTAALYQGDYSIAIGSKAGLSNQSSQSIAIGVNAGSNTQQDSAIAIGVNAGGSNQGANGVAIGYEAGMSNQIGGVAIGHLAGQSTQRYYAIAIGEQAGQYAQNYQGIALGLQAGTLNQGGEAIAIGTLAGASNQAFTSIAIGSQAGALNQDGGIAIGVLAGGAEQKFGAIAIGEEAAFITQSTYAIAIGGFAAYSNQGTESIAIGHNAAVLGQGDYSIAIGLKAGYSNQSSQSIAIGVNAGSNMQQDSAIAIGVNAGGINQGTNAIAIGTNAGLTNQAANSIAIGPGAFAGLSDSIVLDTGDSYISVTPSRVNISRIRPFVGANALWYNNDTKEVSYGAAAPSDGRLKTDVQETSLGLEFIKQLRPVEYKWKDRGSQHVIPDIYERLYDSETAKAMKPTPSPGVRVHQGFIAQDVSTLLSKISGGKDYSMYSRELNPSTILYDLNSLNKDEMIAPMVKAIQELTAQVESLQAQVNTLLALNNRS